MLTTCENMITMAHEGELLKQLLNSNGLKNPDLAAAAGVTPQAIGKQTKQATIGVDAWKKIRRGLVKLQLDPAAVKAHDPVTRPREDLRPALSQMDHATLGAVRKMLQASEEERDRLLWWIDGKLSGRE